MHRIAASLLTSCQFDFALRFVVSHFEGESIVTAKGNRFIITLGIVMLLLCTGCSKYDHLTDINDQGNVGNLKIMEVDDPGKGTFRNTGIWTIFQKNSHGAYHCRINYRNPLLLISRGLSMTGTVDHSPYDIFLKAVNNGLIPSFWSNHWGTHTWLACKTSDNDLVFLPVLQEDMDCAGEILTESEYFEGISRFKEIADLYNFDRYFGSGWLSRKAYTELSHASEHRVNDYFAPKSPQYEKTSMDISASDMDDLTEMTGADVIATVLPYYVLESHYTDFHYTGISILVYTDHHGQVHMSSTDKDQNGEIPGSSGLSSIEKEDLDRIFHSINQLVGKGYTPLLFSSHSVSVSWLACLGKDQNRYYMPMNPYELREVADSLNADGLMPEQEYLAGVARNIDLYKYVKEVPYGDKGWITQNEYSTKIYEKGGY